MKKAPFLAIALLAITGTALAGGKKLHCAVNTKDTVDVAQATKAKLFSDYKGKRYFFCCAMCKPQFEKDPAKFAAKADSIPTPKPAKKK